MEIIVVEELTKIFGKLVAVDHISFTVKEGEIFGFLGPNGAGKTTTINMLTTLIKPTSGSATIAGFDVERDEDKVRRIIGLVPQDLTVDEDLTGMENMMLQARLYHIPKDEAKRRIKEVLELVSLSDFADKKVETYSGGMRKRLELAEGLIHYPRILFLDEPTLGLDVQTRAVMWDYIKKLKEERDMTIFMTTHYMDEADSLCDRVAIIDEGRIKALDTPSNLKDSLGGDIIELELIDPPEDIIPKLSQLSMVREVKEKGSIYRLKVLHGEEALPSIMRKIIEMGIGVRRVSLEKPSLDQVFLEYTGRELRDMEGGREEVRRMRRIMRGVRR